MHFGMLYLCPDNVYISLLVNSRISQLKAPLGQPVHTNIHLEDLKRGAQCDSLLLSGSLGSHQVVNQGAGVKLNYL